MSYRRATGGEKGGISTMRLPNGYGSVVKMSGNRRRPYTVRKTDGFNEKGYPIYKIIGYTETKEEGLSLLAKYNESPWNINEQKITLCRLFEWWETYKVPKLGNKNAANLKGVYSYIAPLSEMQYKSIKLPMMQSTIDNCQRGAPTQRKIKALWGHLDAAALEIDIPVRGYAKLLTTDPEDPAEKVPFTETEIARLWDHQAEPLVDSILVLIYSGWRISELLALEKANIDLEARTMRGGGKTEAGKNRIVPIHNRIMHMIEHRMGLDGNLLFDVKITTYRMRWGEIMDRLGMHHTPHECRHTFRSRLDAAGANPKSCDLLMGHKSQDVGNRVYNHKTLEDLRTAIDLLE